jgi:2-keto-4-pentenoate hydratase/2-oxohepta-3-ene-1,7-dioic acid hydratase in catechol pathway
VRWVSFLRDGSPSFGYVSGDGVVDVGARGRFADLKSAIAADALDDLVVVCGDRPDLPLEGLTYLPPLPNPDKILCVGLNYKAHQEETGRGGEGFPTIFVRFANAQVGHGQPMVRPRESNTLDYEGEIALVIGRGGRRIPKGQALSHVAAYGIYLDGSVREFQRHTSQFTAGKNFPGTGGFGPWLMTPDEVGDVTQMEITTRLNGEVMQNARAELLVFDFGDIIAYCSTFCELTPGDVIVTGTPGGVGAARNPPVFMDEGDVVEVDVKPIGTLRHTIAVG